MSTPPRPIGFCAMRLAKPLGADRKRRYRADRDRSAETHHEGRGDAGPEQALRQSEHQHDDRAGARPQSDGHHRGQAAPPAARSRQLLRLGAVGMTPWQYIKLLMVVMVAVAVKMRGLTDGAREACRRGILRLPSFTMKIAAHIVGVIAVPMCVGVAARGAAGTFGLQVAKRVEEAIPLDP